MAKFLITLFSLGAVSGLLQLYFIAQTAMRRIRRERNGVPMDRQR